MFIGEAGLNTEEPALEKEGFLPEEGVPPNMPPEEEGKIVGDPLP
jgi:hypothetical protein